jgi:opacity protein-like surface antigen
MKKLVIAIATVIAAAAVVSSATATGPVYEDSGFLCGILTPEETLIFTYDSSYVVYASGKAVLKCTAQDAPRSKRVVLGPKNTGVDCGYQFTPLPYWNSVHSVNGQVVLTCNGQVDLNGSPDPARTAGGTAGN